MSRRTFTPTEIERLKREAKKARKREGIQHLEALNRIAVQEGFKDWHELQHLSKVAGTSQPFVDSPSVEDLINVEYLIKLHGCCRGDAEWGCVLWNSHGGEHRLIIWKDESGQPVTDQKLAELWRTRTGPPEFSFHPSEDYGVDRS